MDSWKDFFAFDGFTKFFILTLVLIVGVVGLIQHERNTEAQILKQSCKRTNLIYFTKTNSPAFVYECIGAEITKE